MDKLSFNIKSKIILVSLASFLLSFFICLNSYAFFDIEKRLIFYPIKSHIADMRIKLKDKLEDIYFYSLDGVRLNAWYIKAQNSKPTVIYCHGQGENISLWQSIAQFLSDNGYGVFMIEYRGHGRSKGSPYETGLYLDLESSIKYLKEFEDITNDKLVLWGRSLGGAIVADIASRDDFKGVILESTFTNIRDEAIHLTSTGILEGKRKFWTNISTKFVKHLPLTQKFSTDKKIYKITSPLLIAHSFNDVTVPWQMSYKLSKLNPYAEVYFSKKGSHHSSEWAKDRILEFLNRISQ